MENRKIKWKMMKNRGNKNKETWWNIQKYKMEKRKKQWQMMKNREATMKHDEKVRKNKIRWKKEKSNNDKWWKIEKQQWNMMKNGGKKQLKIMKNKETPMNNNAK